MRLSNLGRRTLLLVSFLWTASAFADSGVGESSLTPVEQEAYLLLRTLRDPEAPAPEVIGQQVHALGSGTLTCLFSALEGWKIPHPSDPEGDAQVLSELQMAAIHTSLEEFGRGAVLPTWELYFEPPLDPASIPAAMISLGSFGQSQDLDQLWDLARASGSDDLPRRVRTCLESSLADILARDVRAYRRLESAWTGLPDSWTDELIRAIGTAADSNGVGALSDFLTWSPEHHRLIASQLILIGPSNQVDLNEELARQLIVRLEEPGDEDVKACALGLGVLEDITAIEPLIEVLADERPAVRASAHHALKALSHKSLSANPQLWQRWFDQETEWWRTQSPALLAELDSFNEHAVQAALREIARHGLHRHELASSIAHLVFSQDESTSVMASRVLAELGSRWGANSLVLALSDESPLVREAALQALWVITGEQHEAGSSAWQEFDFPK